MNYEEDEDEEKEEEQEDEEEEQEERSVAKEITDYEEGKTTYLYDDGTYEVVYHEEASECFVATACYGSALDQHVVFLRQFRDREVMRTRIGKNFMRFFNALYYSFSPSLASFLARHRTPKLVTRYIMVAPTIHLLRLSRYLANPLRSISLGASVAVTGAIFILGYLLVAWALVMLTFHV